MCRCSLPAYRLGVLTWWATFADGRILITIAFNNRAAGLAGVSYISDNSCTLTHSRSCCRLCVQDVAGATVISTACPPIGWVCSRDGGCRCWRLLLDLEGVIKVWRYFSGDFNNWSSARARALLRLLKSREEVASPTAACCLLPAAAADGGCCWTRRGLLKSGCTFRETLITGAARALCARCS